jgi:hypothetical protein
MSETKNGWLTRTRERRRRKKAMTGDSPEKLAEHHTPRRGIVDRALYAGPGGQRRTNFKD